MRGDSASSALSPSRTRLSSSTSHTLIASSDRAITIFNAADPAVLRPAGTLPLDGSAEGYAVDAERGVFYANLEETAETVAIDVRSRAIRSRWRSGCDEPHGLAIDQARRLVFVACADRVIALDTAHNGAVTGTIETGYGVDNIDCLEPAWLTMPGSSATSPRSPPLGARAASSLARMKRSTWPIRSVDAS